MPAHAHLTAVPAAPTPAIGYIRVSMAREEMISPEIQRAAITDWAKRTGRRIIDWVEDLDQSGRNFRRQAMKAIERIEGGEAVEILAYRYDRWGRNALESMANIRRVELAGGQVQSVTEPYDAETAIGKYNRHNALGLAEMQSDIISDNWKAAHANRLSRQLPSAGTARFGYVRLGRVPDQVEPGRYRRDLTDSEGERYEPDQAGGTAEVLEEMYHRYIGGQGFSAVAQWLNTRGIANARGATWSDVTVRNVLDSGFAAGFLQVHATACKCEKRGSCKNRQLVPGGQPPIIDPETWEKYRTVRVERGKKPPRARYPAYPLTALIYCEHCGSAMAVQSAAGKPGYAYRCKRWHHYRDHRAPFPRRAYVEEQVLAELAVWAADIEERAAVTKARKSARAAAEVDRERLTRALAEADAALARLMVQRARDPHMPESVYEAARAELLTTRDETKAELDAAAQTASASVADYGPIISGLIEEWEGLPAQRCRDLLAELVRHITVARVDGDSHHPKVKVTPFWVECGPDCKVCARRPE